MTDVDETERPERALKVILNLTAGPSQAIVMQELPDLVQRWRRDRIAWIAVVGPPCNEIKALIDVIIRGAGFDRRSYIMTSAHPGETLEEVTDFMLALVGDYEGDVAVVEI